MHKLCAASWDTSNQVQNLPMLMRIRTFTSIISLMITGAVQYSDAYFGEGSGPVHLDRVVCEGTEYNLTDCETGRNDGENGHSQDVGVKCQTCNRNGVIYNNLKCSTGIIIIHNLFF